MKCVDLDTIHETPSVYGGVVSEPSIGTFPYSQSPHHVASIWSHSDSKLQTNDRTKWHFPTGYPFSSFSREVDPKIGPKSHFRDSSFSKWQIHRNRLHRRGRYRVDVDSVDTTSFDIAD